VFVKEKSQASKKNLLNTNCIIMKTNSEDISGKDAISKVNKMTRKQAIGKAGFMAISAATTMMLLMDPSKGHAASAPVAPDSEPSGGTWTKRT
jgi:hypothetical protein